MIGGRNAGNPTTNDKNKETMPVWIRIEVPKAAIIAHGIVNGVPGTRAQFRNDLNFKIVPGYCQDMIVKADEIKAAAEAEKKANAEAEKQAAADAPADAADAVETPEAPVHEVSGNETGVVETPVEEEEE